MTEAGLASYVGLIEVVGLFGLVIGWCLWELRRMEKLRSQDKPPENPDD